MPKPNLQMELKIQELTNRAESLGDERLLDVMVHDAASTMASSANNEGYEAQIRFIVLVLGEQGLVDIEKAIDNWEV